MCTHIWTYMYTYIHTPTHAHTEHENRRTHCEEEGDQQELGDKSVLGVHMLEIHHMQAWKRHSDVCYHVILIYTDKEQWQNHKFMDMI